MPKKDPKEIKLNGVGASPGICIGRAYLVDKKGVDVVEKYVIDEDRLQDEIKRFKAAVKKTRDKLREIIKDTPEKLRQQAYILETHMLLLKDKMLYGKTIKTIKKERVNAEWSLRKVVANIKSMFQDMSDPYLRERAADIDHVSDRIMRNLVGAEQVNIGDINQRVILVAHSLSPAETSQIQRERVKGFVTDRGGKASHTGIIARALEIPAVLGLDNVTGMIQNDDLIIIDGTAGIVVINPREKTLAKFEERQSRYEEYKAVIIQSSHLPAETVDGFHMQVMGNIELPEEAVSVHSYGGDGIGLYRTEFQYLSRTDFPGEHELFDKYKDVIEVMTPKPVTIRTLDINGDKALAQTSDFDEPNPALGLRGIRYCLKKTDVFKTQLKAILRAAVFGNVRIMFPMITTYEEICEAKRMLDEAADCLEKEGVIFNRDIKVGILVEVPSAVIMADLMAKEVDFFSIGTNDLIQYSMAIDRGNRQVAHLFQPLDPAILRMIKHVADVAKDKGIKVFICGEMAGYPIHVPILLGIGIDELSMNPQSIPAVKSVIRSLNVNDARLFMNDIFKQTTATKVFELLRDNYGNILTDKLYDTK
ncbi:MAG: phosphoenolpyruvate--protein phosphotransferase [Desulfobacterales bacterium]